MGEIAKERFHSSSYVMVFLAIVFIPQLSTFFL